MTRRWMPPAVAIAWPLRNDRDRHGVRAARLRAGDGRDARESRPRRLADVAADHRQLGLQPARRHRPPQRRAAHPRVVRATRRGAVARRHPARLRRRAVLPEPDGRHARRSTPRRASSSGSIAARCPPISASSCRSRKRIAISRSTAGSSSTTAPTISSTRSTRVTGELRLGNADPRLPDHRAKHGSAPIVANGVLISGRNCQPEGGPEACVITAHDARTGKELWRKRTIPKPGEPGGDSWGDVPDERALARRRLDDPELRPASSTSSTSARRSRRRRRNSCSPATTSSTSITTRRSRCGPTTGETVWYYQHAVDHWDLDHPFERMLIDTAVAPDASEVPWINPRVAPRRAAHAS